MKTLSDGVGTLQTEKAGQASPLSVQTHCGDSDFFNLFYQAILASESLAGFEINLLSFFQQVLQQTTCLLYCNAKQDGSAMDFVLQRTSYAEKLPNSQLHTIFPRTIHLESGSVEKAALPFPLWQNARPVSSLQQNFFALDSPSDNKVHRSILSNFDTAQDFVHCGMLLCRNDVIYGLLLYEQPISHPYLNTPLRLQQFQEFLSLALLHCQTFQCATLDQLTQVQRKYYFLSHAESVIAHYPKRQYQLLMIDADLFKNFNDRFGHLEADYCLQAIAKVIKKSIRTADLIGRFDGAKFICLLHSDSKYALDIAMRIHRALDEKINLVSATGQKIPTPTVSIGIAALQAGQDLSNRIEEADEALYQAKKNGRNQTVVAQT